MEAMEITRKAPCHEPLPDLEVPMINAMVACLGHQHRRFDDLIGRLALAATRLAANPQALASKQDAIEVWNEIRRDLWSHLQIEDELVSAWGDSNHAVPAPMLEMLKQERDELHQLVTALTEPSDDDAAFARILITLAGLLDSHVERFDAEVLPSILRATHP